MVSLTLVVDNVVTLRTMFREELSKGRLFVPADWGSGEPPERGPCAITLQHRGREIHLASSVVHVRMESPGQGVGLQLAPMDLAELLALRAFVGVDDEEQGAGDRESAEPAGATEAGAGGVHEAGERETAEAASVAEDESDDEPADEASRAAIKSLQERIRGLTGAEQLRLAQSGNLAERTALERLYGPTVWETLLRSGRLTLPEVARIARKGSLPRPLVDLIAASAPWLASGEVQRALLSNPRSSPAVVMKVLSAMPRRELQMVPIQTAYPETVRQAAKRRLGR